MRERRKKGKLALKNGEEGAGHGQTRGVLAPGSPSTTTTRTRTSTTATPPSSTAALDHDDLQHHNSTNQKRSTKPSTGNKRRRSGTNCEPLDERATPETTSSNENPKEPTSITDAATTHVVTVPSSLSSKEAKKFRKDARRQARLEGRNVQFADETELQEAQQHTQRPHKKRKLVQQSPSLFPRINDLVQQAKAESEREQKQQHASAEEEQLPEAYKRRYVALDCEMVGIGTDGKTSALARVSIVDWNYQVLLDTFVHVESRVVDFRTKFSGIKPKHIKDAVKPDVVRQKVAEIVKDKILVGHALQNDLHALMLQHPKSLIRDTAKYRPFQRFHNKWRPRKLRDLVQEHLGKTIQDGSHDSVTDAASTMELFRLVRSEWERELDEKKKKKEVTKSK